MNQKFILITDIHMTKPGVPIIGLDPAERFQSVLDHALDHHGDADGMILMGDLVHRGSRQEYRPLQSILSPIPLPVTFMPGNHDHRANFAEIFGQAFGQSVIETPTHRIICLDTLEDDGPIHHAGFLCQSRIDALLDALQTNNPCIVITHHPLGPVGFDGMDAIGLRNGPDIIRILKEAKNVELVISGHIHRHISGSYDGLPFAILPSPCHQMPLVLGDASSATSVDEPAGYGVLLTTPAGPVLHVAQVGLPPTQLQHDPSSA